MTLSREQNENIAQVIGRCEQETNCELIAVLAQKSGDYRYISVMLSAFFMFFLSFFVLIFANLTPVTLLEVEFFIFVVFYLAFGYFEGLIFKFLPKKYLHEKASNFAQKEFNNLALSRLKNKGAVMFFVSAREKYVRIITNQTVKEKVQDTLWQEIVDTFTTKVKAGEFSKGYEEAILNSHKILSKYLPQVGENVNEIPDKVVELK